MMTTLVFHELASSTCLVFKLNHKKNAPRIMQLLSGLIFAKLQLRINTLQPSAAFHVETSCYFFCRARQIT